MQFIFTTFRENGLTIERDLRTMILLRCQSTYDQYYANRILLANDLCAKYSFLLHMFVHKCVHIDVYVSATM